MVEQITLKNLVFYKSAILNRADADYLLGDNGIDWGDVPSQISSRNSIDGLGSAVNSVTITNPRTISIIGWVTSGESSIEQKKKYLSSICNPMDPIQLSCGDYTIEGRMASAIKFAATTRENNEEMCKFSLSIECAYPFFLKHIERKLGAGTEEPISVGSMDTDTEGKVSRINSLPIALENLGDFDVGAEFVIEFSDSYKDLHVFTKDPKTNLPTYFSLLGALNSGAVFRINTETNKKYVSDYDFWDLDSAWVKIYKTIDPEDYPDDYCVLTLQMDTTESTVNPDFSGIKLTIKYDVPYLAMEDM